MQLSRGGQVKRVLRIVLGYNLAIFGVKLAVGLGTGSLAIVADTLHSLTDCLSSGVGLVTQSWAKPEPDREHPYGHQKFEAVGALVIAVLLGVVSFEVIQQAVVRLMAATPPPRFRLADFALLLLVLLVNSAITWYEYQQGQRLDSPILRADALHTLGDLWINLTVLVGMAGVLAGWTWLDTVLAIPVAALVLYSGWRILTINLPWLVDAMAIAPEAIARLATQVPGVESCHYISSRGVVGRQVFIELHLVVTTQDLTTAHRVSEQVEALLQKHYGPARITIHIEPSPGDLPAEPTG